MSVFRSRYVRDDSVISCLYYVRDMQLLSQLFFQAIKFRERRSVLVWS